MDTKAEATQPQFRSGVSGSKPGEPCFGFDEILGHLSAPPETDGSSFTALLELSPPQALELLIKEDIPAKPKPPPIFPSNITLIDRASKFSVFASDNNSPEGTTNLSTSEKLDLVKQELLDSASHPNSSSPAVSTQSLKSSKRKEENKVKESNKKSKRVLANGASEESGGKLPYVHVRARRGQATDSHSLAERARREKINARMKQLQELVPGCSKISGTAMVLDRIINHVRALQHQVEFLSVSLAAVNPSINLNLDALLAAEGGSSIDNSPLGMLVPSMWPEGQIDGSRQHHYQHQPSWGREEDNSNFNGSDSLLNYYPSANTAFLRSSLPKKEL